MKPTKSKLFPLLLLSASISMATMSYAETQVQAGNNIAVAQTQAGKVQGYVQNGVITYKGMP